MEKSKWAAKRKKIKLYIILCFRCHVLPGLLCLDREALRSTKILLVGDILTSAENFPGVTALIPLWRECVRCATAGEAAESSLTLAILWLFLLFIYIFFILKRGIKADVCWCAWYRRGGLDRGADGGCINNVRCNIPHTHLVQISHVWTVWTPTAHSAL